MSYLSPLLVLAIAGAEARAGDSRFSDPLPPPRAAPDPATLDFDIARLAEEERRELQAIVDGLFAAALQLQSGRVEMVGYRRQASDGLTTPYHARLIFDFPSDRVLWTNQDPWRGEYIFGRNDEASFSIRPTGGPRSAVNIDPRSHVSDVYALRPIDVRALPFGSWMLVDHAFSFGKLRPFIDRIYMLENIRRVTRYDDGSFELVFQVSVANAAPVQHTWTRIRLDIGVGGRPTLIEEWLMPTPDEGMSLSWRSSIDWESHEGVWVPALWRTETPGLKSGALRFLWSDVNAPIDAAEFELAAHALPEGTLVWDHRLGEPVLRDRVGGSRPSAIAQLPQRPPTSLARILTLVLCNIVAFAAMLIVSRRGHRSYRAS